MRCPTSEQLARYQLDASAGRDAQRLRGHVARCASCRRELQMIARATQLLESVPPPVMPAHLWAGVASRLPATPGRAVWQGWWQPLAGAGVAAGLLLGMLTMRMTSTPALPVASAASAPYVAEQALLSARDPLTDRASIGVLFAAQRSDR